MKLNLLKSIIIAIAAAGMFASAPALRADNSATQTVSYEVQAITEIAVTGTPSLVISAATAGSAPDSVTDATGKYSYSANATKRITARIDSTMPDGLTLAVTLAAPGSGTANSEVSLSTTDAELVTGISPGNSANNVITYKLSATSAAGVVSAASKTVTFTVTD